MVFRLEVEFRLLTPNPNLKRILFATNWRGRMSHIGDANLLLTQLLFNLLLLLFSLTDLVAKLPSFAASGELNSTVADVPGTLDRVDAAFAGRGTHDRSDGLTIETDDWWVNVRPSNTEPLLRLNVEARSEQQMVALRDETLAIIRGGTDA